MATRLKVNRLKFIETVRTALSAVEGEIAKVEEEQASYDWTVDAGKHVEQLTTALKDGCSEQEFRNLLYPKTREDHRFESRLRNYKATKRDYEDLIQALEMNSEEETSISTGDDQIVHILRTVRRAQQT
jgi:hypothetical protein